jgi:hypothetical protein
VRVALHQLKGWYRLDQLLERKAAIEHALFVTLRDLFSRRTEDGTRSDMRTSIAGPTSL